MIGNKTFNERLDTIFSQLTASTGEEYHKLHNGTKSFDLANSAMNFYENKARASLIALVDEVTDSRMQEVLGRLRQKSYKISQDVKVFQMPARYEPEIVKAYDSVIPVTALDNELNAKDIIHGK